MCNSYKGMNSNTSKQNYPTNFSKNLCYNKNMVKLLNAKTKPYLVKMVSSMLHFQEAFTHILEIDNPGIRPCIYAMWHENQFSIYGIKDKEIVNVLISNSNDGELVATAVEEMGFRVVRGSSARKGCISATLQLIDRLKNGECAAIMMDGPHGPLHKIKGGVFKLARETGAPIVPMHWYSEEKTFVTLPSWDKMKSPFFNCHIINLYGKPIYINENDTNEEIGNQIKASLKELVARAPEEYKKAKQQKLWKKMK